ncbi:hypothetical protein Fcan01_25866 [Folsomia candida]|uniref:Uncharacterized protein n=1 Tax=Folsomia candida TaxID=158441 RepID=A0A226D370_FOLCA|nr:hypothetical protein Fcan01_25866 [Folsomia candida]
MPLKLWPIFFSMFRLSLERETFNDFLTLFTGCTLEIFTSRSYPYDDSRFWIADASLMFPKVKDIKLQISLVVEARSNETIEEYLLSQKSLESVRSKDYCRLGFIDLQGDEEREYGYSASTLFPLMYRTPEPHHVFIRVGVPLPADFGMPTRSKIAYLLDKFAGITCEMFVRGNTMWIFLPKSYLELVFIEKDSSCLPREIQFSSISAESSRRQNFERRHHIILSNMKGAQVDVGQIVKVTKDEINGYQKICGAYKIKDSPIPLICVVVTLSRKFNFTLGLEQNSSNFWLYYSIVNLFFLDDFNTRKLFNMQPKFITPAGGYSEVKTVVFSKKQKPDGFALLTSFDYYTWTCLCLLLLCLNILFNHAGKQAIFTWSISCILVRSLMEQTIDMGKSYGTLLRIVLMSCTILSMNVGNLYRGTCTSQMTTKTLPKVQSDFESVAFSSIEIVTTGKDNENFPNGTKEIYSFFTDIIHERLVGATNESNIYNILKKLRDRTILFLSPWYDFALNTSNNQPIKTSTGFQRLREIFVFVDDEYACNALIKLFRFNDIYFPISYQSSNLFTERQTFITSNRKLARILSPGFYGLHESGILQWWEHRFEDYLILNREGLDTNDTNFGTGLLRALIQWPPKKSPGFENDVVGLNHFVMFGYLLVFLYASSEFIVLYEFFWNRGRIKKY